MKKTVLALFLIILLLVSAAGPVALALVEQSDDYFVTDAAGVLSAVTKEDIINANLDLEERCKGAQIFIVTVEYLDGMYSDEYAMQLFNNWSVGDRIENNGMLLLLATGENKAWL